MIAALGLEPFSTISLVAPASTVNVHVALASGSRFCSLSYPRKFKGTSTLLQCSGNLGSSRSYRNWQNLQCCKFSSSTSASGRLAGFKDDRVLSGRGLHVRCRGCRDRHEHHSPDEEDYCLPSSSNKKERSLKHPTDCSKCPEEEGCDASGTDQECTPEHPVDYTIKVSKELMGVFRYVEKVKRARTKDLAITLRKVSQACFLFSCVRGVLAPLVEVYKTSPPNWKNLLYMIGTFDSFALSYLAMKAAEPLFQLSALATETDCDMMGSINREEEHMLALAIELGKLFRRLRNVTLFIALTQLVQVILQLRDPAFCRNIANIFNSWFECPWGS